METIHLNQKTDLIAAKVKCPVDGDEYLYGVPYVTVPCKKCGTTYKTDFKQDIYTKKARQIEDKLAEGDGIKLIATGEYKSSLIHIRYNYTEQRCWDVSEIKTYKEEFRYCKDCGFCNNCLTCKDCNEQFEIDTKHRKQKCPKCKSHNLTRTYFKETKDSKNNKFKLCPVCKSHKVNLTRTINKTKCHKCDSKNLSDTKINVIHELVILRKKAYMK